MSEEKTPFYKRKAIFYLLVVIAGMFLFFTQLFITKRRVADPNFVFSPSFQLEKIGGGIKESSNNIGEMYQRAKDEIGEAVEISDEEVIRRLQEDGVIDEEEAEQLLIQKEELEEGEVLKIIDEKLDKEKDGPEEE